MIYLITKVHYDDTHVVAYCETEELAEQAIECLENMNYDEYLLHDVYSGDVVLSKSEYTKQAEGFYMTQSTDTFKLEEWL